MKVSELRSVLALLSDDCEVTVACQGRADRATYLAIAQIAGEDLTLAISDCAVDADGDYITPEQTMVCEARIKTPDPAELTKQLSEKPAITLDQWLDLRQMMGLFEKLTPDQ